MPWMLPAPVIPSAVHFWPSGCAAVIRGRRPRMQMSLRRCLRWARAQWRRSRAAPMSRNSWRKPRPRDKDVTMAQMKSSQGRGLDIFSRRPVIPVLTLDDAKQAVALSRALAAGGLDVLEVTLRTAKALEAISAITQELPEVVIGAGTVLDAMQMQ